MLHFFGTLNKSDRGLKPGVFLNIATGPSISACWCRAETIYVQKTTKMTAQGRKVRARTYDPAKNKLNHRSVTPLMARRRPNTLKVSAAALSVCR